MTTTTIPPLIAGLLQPEAYCHDVSNVQLRQTHISWVLLTGNFAYKIKKPVDLGFVDFTTLGRRRRYCEEEVRLNRRFAADLYLGVVPITATGEGAGFRAGGDGVPVEFAVRMRQFDEGQLASRLLREGKLTASHIDELAAVVAAFHESAEHPGEQEWGSPARVREPVVANFAALRPLIGEPSRLLQLDEIEEWSLSTLDTLKMALNLRQKDGFVRDCHGDLHLGNIVNWRSSMTPFDCIEFNPALRRIDVMSEIAFLVMDLDDHGRADLAWRFLNVYLEQTGDYAGLSVLPFYLVYRGIVRAKVDALRLHQAGLAAGEQQRLTAEGHGYLDLAARYTRLHQSSLTITHGVSGSGKTTGTQILIERDGAIRVRSDVERKRLCGIKDSEHVADGVDAGIYAMPASEATYARLRELAQDIVRAGFSAVVDATFLKRKQRENFQQLAAELGVPFRILTFATDELTLRDRIRQRRLDGGDASDATIEVVRHQLRANEPLTPDEVPFVTSPASPGMVTESTPDS